MARPSPRTAPAAATPMAFARAVVAAYRKDGQDPAGVLRLAQITPARLQQPDARITARQMEVLSGAAMQELGDESLGAFARKLPWGTYGMLARASLGAPTLGLALNRWCRHHALVTDELKLQLVEGAAGASIVIADDRSGPAGAREFSIVHLLRNIHGLACWYIDSRIPLQGASFPYPKPAHADAYAHMFPGGPLKFGAAQATIRFDAGYLALPLRRDEKAMRQMLRRALPLTVLQYRRDRLLVEQVRQALINEPHRSRSAEGLAAMLHMSARTLHRQLKEEGAALQQVKDEVRFERARDLLHRTGQPVKQVAGACGFASEKSFARAFRQWAGYRPRRIANTMAADCKEHPMDEQGLRSMLDGVRTGRVSRRSFIARMASLGIAAPFAAQMLVHAGLAQAQSTIGFPYKPGKRGGGGLVKLLFWQGPTLLNPHFATGTKDAEAAQLFYESLVSFDMEGFMVPVLAAEIPTAANGGVSRDGRVITWKLKRGVAWHDGHPFTADDVVFNWAYGRDPATAAVTSGTLKDIRVEKADSHTVRVVYPAPTPFWGMFAAVALIPKHLFADYSGSKSRDAPANLKPVGTGPFKFADFKPGDLVRGTLNPNYHMPDRPYFDAVELKGGGDASSAARAVLQTGEFDFAWNLQVEDEVLKRMEDGGKGKAVIVPTGAVEFCQLNNSDPWTEVDGERSNPKTRHFAFADANVRRAMALLVDRKGIQDFIYGRTGTATANFLNAPARFRSPNTRFEFNIGKAGQMLDAAGWKKGADGVRAKDGRRFKLVFQTSANGIRQKEQAVIKQACQKAGIEMELKSVTPSVFFSTDVANPDTNGKFWADVQMYTVQMGPPDPARLLDRFVSWEIASKANKWQGRNAARWRSEEFDKLFRAAELEMDPVKRAALFIAMNDMVAREAPVIPIVSRPRVVGVSMRLVTWTSPWDNDLAGIHSWYRPG